MSDYYIGISLFMNLIFWVNSQCTVSLWIGLKIPSGNFISPCIPLYASKSPTEQGLRSSIDSLHVWGLALQSVKMFLCGVCVCVCVCVFIRPSPAKKKTDRVNDESR